MGLLSYKTDPQNPLLIILITDRGRMMILKMRLCTNVVHLFLPLALSILLFSPSIINGQERKDEQKQQSTDATNCQNCCQNHCRGNPPPPPQGPQPSLPEPLPLPLPPPPPSNENTPPPPCNPPCCQYPPNSPPNSDTDSPPNSYTNTPPMPYTYVPSSSSRLPPSFDTFLLLLLLPPLLRCGTILQC